MNYTLSRQQSGPDGIFGTLIDESGAVVAHTLEHAYPTAGGWVAKIPSGAFTCVRGQHRLASMTQAFTTFEITGVPGHSNLLFHAGNYDQDSEGCVLLGEQQVGNMVTNSRVTFAAFMASQDGADSFILTVI